MVAISHCNPCTTAAGALDTYAKGMMQENPLYCAMASPKARRKQLEDGFLRGEGQKTASETVLLYPAVSYDQAAEAPVKVRLEDGYRFDTDRGYRVQNLKEKDTYPMIYQMGGRSTASEWCRNWKQRRQLGNMEP